MGRKSINNETEIDDFILTYFNNRNWASGNTINPADLTFGNKHATSYQYSISVTVENTTIQSTVYPSIYGYGNSGQGLDVTLTYDASTTVIGEEIVGNEYAKIIRLDSSQE